MKDTGVSKTRKHAFMHVLINLYIHPFSHSGFRIKEYEIVKESQHITENKK